MVDQPHNQQSGEPEVVFSPAPPDQPPMSPFKRHAMFVVILLTTLFIVGGSYFFVAQYRANQLNGLPEEVINNEGVDCTAVGNEVADVPEECKDTNQNNCGGEEQPECPAEATLGESVTRSPIEWPVDITKWPKKADKPIANCDLLYSKEGNATISVGLEINIAEGTPVIIGASGKVVYLNAGNVVIETSLKNSNEKTLYLAYGYLRPGSLGTLKLNDTVNKGAVLGLSGSGGAKAELSQSVLFGIWTASDNFAADHTKLNTEPGKALLKKLQHPLNYLTLDGRKISGCKNSQPYNLPVSIITGEGSTTKLSFPLNVKKSGVLNQEIFKNGTTTPSTHPYTAFDVQAKAGTPVVSMVAGTIVGLSTDRCGGRFVSVYNGDQNRRYSYMHLDPSSVTMKVGQKVTSGMVIGSVGATKRFSCSTVDHLHIDVVAGKVRVPCSASNCNSKTKAMFLNVGPELFTAYQKLL